MGKEQKSGKGGQLKGLAIRSTVISFNLDVTKSGFWMRKLEIGLVTYKLYPKPDTESVNQICSKMRLITLEQKSGRSSYMGITAGWVELRRPGPIWGVSLRCWFPWCGTVSGRVCWAAFVEDMVVTAGTTGFSRMKCPASAQGKMRDLKGVWPNFLDTGRWCFPWECTITLSHRMWSLRWFAGADYPRKRNCSS